MSIIHINKKAGIETIKFTIRNIIITLARLYILFSSIKKLFVFTNTSSPMPSPPGVMGIIFDIVARELLIKTLIILISNSKKSKIIEKNH